MRKVISARQVLCGPAGERISDGAVLVDGDTIQAVGPSDDVARQAGPDAERLHYPDATVLPGLINCHVHLAFDAGPAPIDALRASGDHDLMLGMAGRAQQLLAAGVTTARDLGDRGGLAVPVRDAIARGELAGPRLLVATVPLTVPGGHCWFLGGEVDGDAAIRERVRHNAELGADVIKVMASGGEITPEGARMWESQFSTEQLRIIVSEAAAHGLPVAAHAHGAEAITSAVAAGVRTIEHCSWLTENFGFEPRDEVAREMAARGICASHAGGPGWRGMAKAAGQELADRVHGRASWLDGHGVPMVLGTDAGLTGSPFTEIVGALELYEYVGIGRERIVELATTAAATAIGLSGTTGRLAAGHAADVLVVRGDPLAELAALREIELVLASGRQFP